MASATCGAGYAHSSGIPDITPVCMGSMLSSLLVLCDFYFIPCVVCPDSILFLRMNGITIWNFCDGKIHSNTAFRSFVTLPFNVIISDYETININSNLAHREMQNLDANK